MPARNLPGSVDHARRRRTRRRKLVAGGVGGSRESFGPQWRDRDMYESPPSAAYRGGDGDRGHGGCAPSSEPGDITADLVTDVPFAFLHHCWVNVHACESRDIISTFVPEHIFPFM